MFRLRYLPLLDLLVLIGLEEIEGSVVLGICAFNSVA